MKCVICKRGETRRERISVILERDGMSIVFKEVPAQGRAARRKRGEVWGRPWDLEEIENSGFRFSAPLSPE